MLLYYNLKNIKKNKDMCLIFVYNEIEDKYFKDKEEKTMSIYV